MQQEQPTTALCQETMPTEHRHAFVQISTVMQTQKQDKTECLLQSELMIPIQGQMFLAIEPAQQRELHQQRELIIRLRHSASKEAPQQQVARIKRRQTEARLLPTPAEVRHRISQEAALLLRCQEAQAT